MAYDEDGHWTSLVTPDDEGFVNFLADATPNTTGPMTAVKAAALISKRYG